MTTKSNEHTCAMNTKKKRISSSKLTEIYHLDKLLFPEDAITKGQLLEYYHQVAPLLLPYCHNRAITMERFPHGIEGVSFYQKSIPHSFPDWIPRKKIANKGGGSTTYVVCKDRNTLLYLVYQACITPHAWLSTITRLNYPDTMIFDLDPAGEIVTDFTPVRTAAYALKDALAALGLEAWVMTTGSRGLHLRVPLKPEYPFESVRAFARSVAETVVKEYSREMTLESRKAQRGNRLLIDIMRNGFGATAVLPYAVRARPHAPIALPVSWQELTEDHFSAQKYTITTPYTHIQQQATLWKEMSTHAFSLKKLVFFGK